MVSIPDLLLYKKASQSSPLLRRIKSDHFPPGCVPGGKYFTGCKCTHGMRARGRLQNTVGNPKGVFDKLKSGMVSIPDFFILSFPILHDFFIIRAWLYGILSVQRKAVGEPMPRQSLRITRRCTRDTPPGFRRKMMYIRNCAARNLGRLFCISTVDIGYPIG